MKKEYEKPFMEKIEFDYRNVIVASNGGNNIMVPFVKTQFEKLS